MSVRLWNLIEEIWFMVCDSEFWVWCGIEYDFMWIYNVELLFIFDIYKKKDDWYCY